MLLRLLALNQRNQLSTHRLGPLFIEAVCLYMMTTLILKDEYITCDKHSFSKSQSYLKQGLNLVDKVEKGSQ